MGPSADLRQFFLLTLRWGLTLLVPALLGLQVSCRAQGMPAPGAPPTEPEKLEPPEAPITLQKLLALPNWMNLQVERMAQPFVNPIGGLTRSGAWMQQTNLLATFSTDTRDEPPEDPGRRRSGGERSITGSSTCSSPS